MRILKFLEQFRSETGGNVAMVFALCLIPILVVAGFALDFQETSRQVYRVQHVIDAASLAGARNRQKGAEEDAVRAEVQDYFAAMMEEENLSFECDDVVVTFADSGNDIHSQVTCEQATSLSTIAGISALNFTVNASATYGMKKVDVAFVFDISSSMNSDGRLGDLKLAAQAAVNALLPAESSDSLADIRVAMVAYNHAVDAGDYFDDVVRKKYVPAVELTSELAFERYGDYMGQVFVDLSGDRFFDYEQVICEGTNKNDDCYDQPARWDFESTCVYERTGDEAYTDAAPTGTIWSRTNWIPAGAPFWDYEDDREDEGDSRRRYFTDKINGQDEIENGGANSDDGAFNRRYVRCEDTPPIPLTRTANTLTSAITSMSASVGTGGHVGLAWGWYLISPEWSDIWPSSSMPLDYDEEDSMKVIILMTDGQWDDSHYKADPRYPSDNSVGFNHGVALCDAMKEDPYNIVIYTVGFRVADDPDFMTDEGKTIVEHCATNSTYAYTAADGDELLDAYTEIAESIADLRISQ